MMDLVHDGGPAVGEPVDQVRLPEGVLGVERRGDELVHQRVQFGVSARRRNAHVPDMPAGVEARHVLPARQRPVEDRAHRPLEVARQPPESLDGQLREGVERDRAVQQ